MAFPFVGREGRCISEQRLTHVSPTFGVSFEELSKKDEATRIGGSDTQRVGEVVEISPDKKIVWRYDARKMNGNEGKRTNPDDTNQATAKIV
ncbi:MAG: hypothetical protein CMJ83_09525 [Planctomycetes bacterium]|nr:hypothetical protein [Planctomycetota bacterium]